MVVADSVSKTIHRELRRAQPDFLLMRPLDPVALQLLVQHALYAGPERRSSSRVALNATIKVRANRLARRAALVELSMGGCRIVSRRTLELGQRLELLLPPELCGGGGSTLAGRVVANHAIGQPEQKAACVAFEGLHPIARGILRHIMTTHAVCDAPMKPRSRPVAHPLTEATAEETGAPEDVAADFDAVGPERRSSDRRSFKRRVLSTSAGNTRILIGRDLSRGGMRVAHDPQLAVGDELKLVLHGFAGRKPLLISAWVARDEGRDGHVLRFHELSKAVAAGIDELVAALPSPSECEPGSGASPNVLVSEIV
jgi:hypothetical protein